MAEVVLRALAKDPADRQPSAHALAVDLADAAGRSYGPRWISRSGVVVRLDDDVRNAADQPAEPAQLAADENQQLQAALQEAGSKLAETAAAQETARTEHRPAIDALEQTTPDRPPPSAPAPPLPVTPPDGSDKAAGAHTHVRDPLGPAGLREHLHAPAVPTAVSPVKPARSGGGAIGRFLAAWGGGELASADGLRFVVPVRTINAGPNPKYFGKGARGVTYYNFASDQFTGFHGIVIPGTPKDWYYLLEGLLEQETSLRPVEVTSDTAGASEMGFGIFRLLGWQFSPRLAGAGSATLYRVDPAAAYGPLHNLIRTRVNTGIIVDNWDDLLRVAGSLLTGAIRPAELFRYLAGGGTPIPVGPALIELGKLDRSAYFAGYFDDELLRRRVNTQLNRQESRHQLCRKICHGQKGELRQKYREGQEDQLGALGFLTNVCVLWNTVYTARALDQIRAEGKPAADVARLSPLGFDHLKMLGRYNFSLPDIVRDGQLRPLRTPAPGQ
ncbi:Tn3 family transposase [Candidatus Protofrankia californiensis]|uniref:Tn3 family transposase n=1 Tax=Candidatus Protofrankia californiensis TaxID=1839754 RepID=UPI003204C94B